MKAALVPCSNCRRHVRATESSCPFCAANLTIHVEAENISIGPRRRLGSLAVMAFRATALSAAMTACGGKVEDPAEGADAASDATGGAGRAGMGGSSAGGSGNGGGSATGGSSATGGTGGTGGTGATGGSSATGGTGGSPPLDGGPVPIYRATPPG